MTNPLHAIQQLIDDKRAVYFASGLGSSVNGRIYVTIWGCPSNKILSRGYGDTIIEAARDALSHVDNIPQTIETRLPGLVTRGGSLPGLD